MKARFHVYYCDCGWYYVQLSAELWYGPLYVNSFPQLMDPEEFAECYPDCAPIPAISE